jgi:hypothetical protein
MAGPTLNLGNYSFPERNGFAKATIQKYATQHAATDAAIGLAGFLPVPGAAPATIVASLAIQIPIYKSLARDLSRIYEAPLDEVTSVMLNNALWLSSGAKMTADMAGEFGREFITEVGSELVGEMGMGFAASFIPIIGGLFSMGLEIAVAATMTWRVGTMIAIYYQYGGRWITNRHETYERAKDMTGGLSPGINERVNLDNIPRNIPEVLQYQAEELARFVADLLSVNADLSDNKIREILRKKGVPDEVIEEVIRRVRR